MFSTSATENGDGDEEEENDETGARADGGDHLQRHERRRCECHQRRFHAHLVRQATVVGAVILGPKARRRRRRKQTRLDDFTADDFIALRQLYGEGGDGGEGGEGGKGGKGGEWGRKGRN